MNCHHSLINHAIAHKFKAKGFFWNTDKVNKLNLSNYHLGLNHQIPIYVYLQDGSFYKEYPNQRQASNNLNIDAATIKNCRLFGLLHRKGYYFCEVKSDKYAKARHEYILSRPVYQFNGDTGEFIKEYSSQLEAEMDYPESNINKSIKTKSKCESGFLWGLEKLTKYNTSTKGQKRQVGQYDLEGNLVKIYPSATAAEKENGTSVWKVLNGTNKTQKGFIYRYLN